MHESCTWGLQGAPDGGDNLIRLYAVYTDIPFFHFRNWQLLMAQSQQPHRTPNENQISQGAPHPHTHMAHTHTGIWPRIHTGSVPSAGNSGVFACLLHDSIKRYAKLPMPKFTSPKSDRPSIFRLKVASLWATNLCAAAERASLRRVFLARVGTRPVFCTFLLNLPLCRAS